SRGRPRRRDRGSSRAPHPASPLARRAPRRGGGPTVNPEPPPSACPDDDVIDAMLQGALDADALRAIDDHVDSCEACAQLLVDLVVLTTPTEEDRLRPGAQISRYTVTRQVGEGGM